MTDFPMDIVIFNKIVEVFNQTRSYVLLLFPLAFFIRIAFGFILLRLDSFTDIVKDSLFLFLGLFFFTDILKMALQIPYFVSSELSFGEWRNVNLGDGIFTKALRRIVDWIGILSYWISFGLYVVIISILGFFAGYILFFGTMFRAYGMLKIFFILLFTVSLWPLLWYSINFAVFTIAVSDNALANNVIIGGASLAKLFIPIWLISKASKFPVAQTLKKISFTGGSMAYAGGSYAYSALNNDTTNNVSQSESVQNDSEINNEGGEINVVQTESSSQENDNYMNEPEDFSIREEEPETVFLPEESGPQESSLGFNKQENQSIHQENHIENNISKENTIQSKQELHLESNPQITKEITQSQNISQNHNESILNDQSHNREHEESIPAKQKIFDEAIHREEWIEEGENYIAPRHYKNKDGDNEL